ncbi:tannase and feruloyl esterase [Dothidotthia symphoricarpi CBS 119687]|uniref:Carboxylic ester hydrolase n=1 Tax=Dothidotthia symphoricarpi CBS 119687 TaxID=1392245 RepID=A0A6A6ATL9_9PLEO|nr:tannase and feruloyl esterase [Dothidotthia symphoricarpi CBS 119687]KAF2135030.1 tannase and feruloyl esterase [Dothidotthia symphoricarpi CBS 119687]
MLSQLLANCTASLIPFPTVVGAEFLSVQASPVSNYSLNLPASYEYLIGDVDTTNLSFCNVTLTHTHPGHNDTVITQAWLPVQPAWNNRFQAVGGGQWSAGLDSNAYLAMTVAVAGGFATVTTNGGVPSSDPDDWALLSPGNVNVHALEDFASVALKDSTLAAKSVIQSFYGQSARYSYWRGCSQGGRQGLMFAQKYPDVFDGILAAAPAIYSQFLVAAQFPQQVMNEMGQYPHPSEIDALTTAAIAACDGLDGVVDGIISNPDACHFDPYTLVGTPLNGSSCSNSMTISKAAARVADAAWNNARSANGSFLWYTPGYSANLTASGSIAETTCSNCTSCQGETIEMVTDEIRLFVEKNPNFNVSAMSRRDFERALHTAAHEYDSIIGTSSPDLAGFRKAGGKMITYHGLVCPPLPTLHA